MFFSQVDEDEVEDEVEVPSTRRLEVSDALARPLDFASFRSSSFSLVRFFTSIRLSYTLVQNLTLVAASRSSGSREAKREERQQALIRVK